MRSQPPKRVIALLNVMAGEMETDRSERIRDTVMAAFAAHGMRADVECLTGKQLEPRAKEAVQMAASEEVDGIVAGGGDGTIRTVASLLAGTAMAMGVLPLGTYNHFAKDLGIPLDVRGAVAVIAAGNISQVDVGEVNRHVFVNHSSIGVYPYMVLDRERRRRRTGLKKWAAMVLAGIRMLRVFPLRRLRVRTAGRVEPYRTPCLFVGNNKYELDLTAPRKRRRLDGGELWFYIVRQQTRLGLLLFTLRSMAGLADERDLTIFPARDAEIGARSRRVAVSLDGEVAFLHHPLHYRSRARDLRVFAPAAEESAGPNM